jgi:hypothetical protein
MNKRNFTEEQILFRTSYRKFLETGSNPACRNAGRAASYFEKSFEKPANWTC